MYEKIERERERVEKVQINRKIGISKPKYNSKKGK